MNTSIYITYQYYYYTHYAILYTLYSHLKWVARSGSDGALEDLVTTGTDGLVLQWSLRKGLAFTTLMHLKRNIMVGGLCICHTIVYYCYMCFLCISLYV